MTDQDETPAFLKWFTALYERGAARFLNGTVCLDEYGSKRFAVGVAPDGRPVLGMQRSDIDHLASVIWRRAVIVRRYLGRDWIGLNAEDITAGVNPTPMKVWIPVDLGTFSHWHERPKKLYIAEIRVQGGKPYPAERDDAIWTLPVRLRDGR